MPSKRTIPRVCEQCGKPFLAVAWKAQNGHARFCSNRCANRSWKRTPRATIPRQCQQCGSDFIALAKEVKRGDAKFCSHGCAATFHRLGIRPLVDPAERLWTDVDKTGDCWLWTGLRVMGYGQIRINGKRWKPHRLAYMLTYGPIPHGMVICHACDEKLCCRPSHLFAGTSADNSRDMVTKGRQARGERSAQAKLTAQQVIDIRQRHAAGETSTILGGVFGVTRDYIMCIVNRKSWKHIT